MIIMSFQNKPMKCVILCAGKGTRLGAENTPKPLYKIKGKPILYYIIKFWKKFTNDFIFVVGYKKEMIIDFVKKLPINAEYVEQKELKGIAHATHLTKYKVTERFIVVLGDCICSGNFIFPKKMENGFGMIKTNDINTIRNSFSVEVENGVAKKLIEKPSEPKTNLCGMGFYFFTKKVFEYISMTSPSKMRNEIEITDVMQKMIDSGEILKPVVLEGRYINITYPEDIKKAKKIIEDENDRID